MTGNMTKKLTMKWTLSILLGLLVSCSHSQSEESVEMLDAVDRSSVLDSLGLDMDVARNSKFRFQFVATSFKQGKINKSVSYGTDKYYYPASLVKLPAALVLLEILNERRIPTTAFPEFDTINACGSTKFVEICKEHQVPFSQMLQELIVVSDNHFYNALYHFITPAELNARLNEKGFEGIKIYRAFTGCDKVDQLRTYPNKVDLGLYLERSSYHHAATEMDSTILDEEYQYTEERLFGSKHENADGDIIDGPYDLNYQIEIPLDQIHQILLSFLYPNLVPEEQRWKITPADRKLLEEALGAYPSEIEESYRSLSRYKDDVYKYVQNTEGYAEGRTFGKLGLSYGFASETVYVPSEGVGNGVLLTYSVYVNSNDIVNDGEYDYETVARPFAEALFSKILEWHKK